MTPEERRDLASFFIVSNLGNRVHLSLTSIRNEPHQMWTHLHKRYAESTLTSKPSLQEFFLTAKMQPKSDVREHVSTIKACVVQLSDIGEQMSEGVQLKILLKCFSYE